MAHPDDDIVSSRAASHGPAGSGRSKGGAKSPSLSRRADIDATDPDEDDMTIFANLKFPPYEFREFPKAVKRQSDGAEKVCNNQSEELAWISALPEGSVKEPSALELERDALAKQVAELRAQLPQVELPLKPSAKK